MSLVERRVTPARVAASRANGKKSQGPKTPEGKARCSLNALKTGAYAKTDNARRESMLRRGENPGGFEQLHQEAEEWQPEYVTQATRVKSIAENWVASRDMADVEAVRHAGKASFPQSTVATGQRAADEPADRSGDASFAQNAENLSEDPSEEFATVVTGAGAAKNEKNGSIKPEKCFLISDMTIRTNLEQTC
jgi:hypothetical protein